MMRNLLLTLVALVVADGLITEFVTRNRFGREANPFLATIVGDGKFLLLKLIGGVLAAVILWDIHKKFPKLGLASTLFFVVVYTGIIFWNVACFFIAQSQ
jgi:hypothetical protein